MNAVPAVTLVHACLRDGRGGSPTAVVAEIPMTEAERRRVPERLGASHAVFISDGTPGGGPVALRFFTSEGELPACGHGTVAALALLADQAGGARRDFVVHAGGRSFAGYALAADEHGRRYAAFDPGPVELRKAEARERDLVVPALGASAPELDAAVWVASVGRPRMLVPIATRDGLAALQPDQARLRDACDELGLLGCYAHSPRSPENRLAARMFAPSIGVPEDIANANSTACLAALLLREAGARLTVDMGDALGAPASITATLHAPGRVHVGGLAALRDGGQPTPTVAA